jgi:hypothetical protein
MATNRRVRDYRRRSGDDSLSRSQVGHLITGCAGSSLLSSDSCYETRGEFAEAWDLLREPILEWFALHHPGMRPFAYWLLDEPYPQPGGMAWANPGPGLAVGWAPPTGNPRVGDISHRVLATAFVYPVGDAAVDLAGLFRALQGD